MWLTVPGPLMSHAAVAPDANPPLTQSAWVSSASTATSSWPPTSGSGSSNVDWNPLIPQMIPPIAMRNSTPATMYPTGLRDSCPPSASGGPPVEYPLMTPP